MAAAPEEGEMHAYAEKICAAFDKRTAQCALMASGAVVAQRDGTAEVAVAQMKMVCDDLETSAMRAANYLHLKQTDLSVTLPRFKNPFKVKNNGKVMQLFSSKGEMLSSVDALRFDEIPSANSASVFGGSVCRYLPASEKPGAPGVEVKYSWMGDHDCIAEIKAIKGKK